MAPRRASANPGRAGPLTVSRHAVPTLLHLHLPSARLPLLPLTRPHGRAGPPTVARHEESTVLSLRTPAARVLFGHSPGRKATSSTVSRYEVPSGMRLCPLSARSLHLTRLTGPRSRAAHTGPAALTGPLGRQCHGTRSPLRRRTRVSRSPGRGFRAGQPGLGPARVAVPWTTS